MLLLLSRRKEHIVEDQAVARGVGMLMQVGRFFIDLVLVVFGIMASVKSPEPLSKNAVQVLYLPNVFVFAHDDGIGLDEVLFETRGLSEEPGNNACVILRQHGRNGIPF